MLLVHSPVVGPSTWSRVAEAARNRGVAVAVPDLSVAASGSERPLWSVMVEIALNASDDLEAPVTLAGHSGAGAFLPLIGQGLDIRLGHLVFVDAVIPPEEGHHSSPPRLAPLLDEQTHDGILKPWLDWWDVSLVSSMLPDRGDREALRADLPSLPRSFYDEEIPVPSGWSEWPCRYLRTSPAYEEESNRARERGWPTSDMEGTHLSLFTDPRAVLERIEALISAA